jgi:hypothetical protein
MCDVHGRLLLLTYSVVCVNMPHSRDAHTDTGGGEGICDGENCDESEGPPREGEPTKKKKPIHKEEDEVRKGTVSPATCKFSMKKRHRAKSDALFK